MASRDKGLHPSPPVPSASPPRLQGTTDMGLLGISSFRDMPASLFVSSSLALGRCSGQVCLPPAPLPSHTHTHKTGQLIKTSSLPYLGTFSHQGPLSYLPKFKPSVPRDKSPHKWHTRTAAHPHNVAAAGRRPAFYRKDIVSHILPCPQHRLKTVDPGPSPERNKPHRLLHRHVPGGVRLPTQGGAPAQY